MSTSRGKRKAPKDTWAPPAPLTVERVTEADPDGQPVVHHRVVDTLGKLLRSGTITPIMHDAARDFHAAFTVAAYGNLPTTQLIRVSGAGHAGDLTDHQVGSRRRVAAAIEALGGFASPAGSCVWHVAGLQCSLREWALRQGWNGRSVDRDHAVGILVAALGVLVRHYGYDRPPGVRSAPEAPLGDHTDAAR